MVRKVGNVGCIAYLLVWHAAEGIVGVLALEVQNQFSELLVFSAETANRVLCDLSAQT